jgi:hypothetical protein
LPFQVLPYRQGWESVLEIVLYYKKS